MALASRAATSSLAATSITLGRKVLLARNVYIADHSHAFDDTTRAVLDQGINAVAPVEIGDGAWLGENVVVGPGVRIGQGAVIGANSVVLTDVEDFASAVGAPARVIRSLEEVRRSVRRALFVSYYFPPIGGAGAQRPLRMVQHLAERGYSSVVVTGSGQSSDRWAPRDDELELAIPPSTEIHRIPGPEPEGLTGWPGRAERWLRRPGPWARWLAQGTLVEARREAADTQLVYTWLQPYVSAEAGFALTRELGIPWVADLGSIGALDEMMVYPSRIHRELDLRLMGSLLGGAAAIVMSTREAARRLVERLPHLGDRPIVVIPNGYDADDFAGPIEPRQRRSLSDRPHRVSPHGARQRASAHASCAPRAWRSRCRR